MSSKTPRQFKDTATAAFSPTLSRGTTIRLDALELRDFRNFEAVSLRLSERYTIFSGSNGQGKTNLLEAAHLLCTGRSFRLPKLDELPRFGTQQALLKGILRIADVTTDVSLLIEQGRRTLRLDGKRPAGQTSRPRGATAVAFTPDDLQIPRGSPGDRRRLIDRAIANIWPAHVTLCRDYQKTLRNRNHVLRERQRDHETLLDVFDQQLAGLGGKLAVARLRYLDAIRPALLETFEAVGACEHPGDLLYQSSLLGADDRSRELSAVARRLQEGFAKNRQRDLARQTTGDGPHHDDVLFTLAGRSAKKFASQGQVRALVLSFKIAQITDTYERHGHYPILFLDDVSSELDPDRNRYLFDFINKINCQVLLSTTRPELVLSVEKSKHFHVIAGTTREV